MRSSIAATVLAAVSAASAAAVQGFNYGATLTTGAPKDYQYFKNEFNQAKGLAGTNGAFTSARLYTSIQAGTQNFYSEAFQAAIDTNTRLLLGIWASAGQEAINNELAALRQVIQDKGEAFTSLVDGLSVGSEDLYRTSAIGIRNKSGVGAMAPEVSNYINQAKQAVGSGILVGHVDTYTSWIERTEAGLTNQAVIDASDFIGFDAYPYFQDTVNNPIEQGEALFDDALGQTRAAVGGKPIWITETGWPVSGPTSGKAVANTANAKTYWDAVACKILGQTNTWWYTLQDATPDTPSPSFGLVGAGGGETPLYDLTCPGKTSSPPATSKPAASKPAASGAQADAPKADAPKADAPVANAPKADAPEADTPAPAPASGDKAVAQPNTGDSKPAPAPPATGQTAGPAPVPAKDSPAGACPADLSGAYEYPHLIISVDKNSPDTAPGTSFNGTITSTISSIYNFDIPPSDAGKQCTLVFLFPEQKDLVTSAFDISGSGNLDVKGLEAPATEQTTYNNAPHSSTDCGVAEDVKPGNSYTIATGECAAGQRIGYEVSATGDLALEYFQDYNPSPIGLYITVC